MLNVNSQFRIDADVYNVIVEEYKTFNKKDGSTECRWVPVSYHAKLGGALDYIVDRNVRAGIGEGLTKLNERIKRLEKEVARFKATYHDLYQHE